MPPQFFRLVTEEAHNLWRGLGQWHGVVDSMDNEASKQVQWALDSLANGRVLLLIEGRLAVQIDILYYGDQHRDRW